MYSSHSIGVCVKFVNFIDPDKIICITGPYKIGYISNKMNNVEITNCNTVRPYVKCGMFYAEFGCILSLNRHCDKTVSQTSPTAQ